MTANNNTVQGIYALQMLVPKHHVPDAVYASPSIAGVTLNMVWGQIEPSKGVYDWSLLDHEIQRALASGKEIALSVTPNHPDSPQWLFAEGAQAYTFHTAQHHTVNAQDITIASP